MKKFLCVILAVAMCLAMSLTAFAVEGEFVPSVSYKDAPELVGADLNGEDISAYIIITSILEALNNSTNISAEARAELLYVYEQLTNGSMTLPLDYDYVIRDLFDISLSDERYEHILNQEGTFVKVSFRIGEETLVGLHVMHYDDDQWKDVPFTVNGDGTITCTFEDFCPVVFVYEAESPDAPITADISKNWALWIGVMAISAAAMVVVVANRRKIFG